jgi:hypothetical protein
MELLLLPTQLLLLLLMLLLLQAVGLAICKMHKLRLHHQHHQQLLQGQHLLSESLFKSADSRSKAVAQLLSAELV